jgi:hypothetical protein
MRRVIIFTVELIVSGLMNQGRGEGKGGGESVGEILCKPTFKSSGRKSS